MGHPKSSFKSVVAVAVVTLAFGAGSAARGEMQELTGKEAVAHPAGKAFVEAAKLLRAGKLEEVRKNSSKEVRDEWNALSATEKQEEVDRAKERSPDPKSFSGDLSARGILYIDGDTARISVPSEDGNVTVMGFANLEGGAWRVTGGPFTVDTSPVVETEPSLAGEAILGHEIGKLLLAYTKELQAGRFEKAMELATAGVRAERLAASATERKESDEYRRKLLPPPATLEKQLREGGKVYIEGEKAYLNLMVNEQTANPDGSTSYSSSSTAIPFALENGAWRIAD